MASQHTPCTIEHPVLGIEILEPVLVLAAVSPVEVESHCHVDLLLFAGSSGVGIQNQEQSFVERAKDWTLNQHDFFMLWSAYLMPFDLVVVFYGFFGAFMSHFLLF